MIQKEQITDYFRDLQDRICRALEEADGTGRFQEDHWERPGGGGGRSRVLEGGAVLEKGGVGFSAVWGELQEPMHRSMGLAEGTQFYATGVSIVMHPHSPKVPIIHMNVRYFELSNGTSWFGGGIDLTPIYVEEADARWFHRQLKLVCDRHSPDFYPRFKPWADAYFFNAHRNETRGIGGIFFDHLKPDEQQPIEFLFGFVSDLAEAFAPIYTSLIIRRSGEDFSETEKHWQLLRRGRYVEFNLVHDRGTKFGLETNGRTESILMSLPPLASWKYNFQPAPGSREAETLGWLRKGVEWV